MSKRREPLEFNVRFWSPSKKHWTILAKFSWQSAAEFFAATFSREGDDVAKIAVFHRHTRQRIYVAGKLAVGAASITVQPARDAKEVNVGAPAPERLKLAPLPTGGDTVQGGD